MNKISKMIALVLNAAAVGLAVAAVVLGYLEAIDLASEVNLLALGLVFLSFSGLQKQQTSA